MSAVALHHFDVLEKELATKDDLVLVRSDLENTKLSLQKEIAKSSNRVIIWVAGLLVVSGIIQHFFK